MTEKREIIPRRFNESILVGLFAIVVLGLAGLVCPVMADMLEDFGFESHWRYAVCSAGRWHWTLPVALILAGLLIWKVPRLSLRANRVTNILTLVGIGIVAAAVFYTTMCFVIRGNTMTSPFGSFTARGM